MLKITVSEKKRGRGTVWLMLLVSLLLHIAVYAYSSEIAAKIRTQPRVIKVAIQQSRAPEKKPEIKPEEPKPKPKPEPKPEPEPPKPEPEPPKPAPVPNQEPPKAPEEPAAEIFGVTKDSLGASDSGISVRVGNTLGKEMEKEYIDPEKIKPLPKPKEKKKVVPASQLTSMPSWKTSIKPVYTDAARKKEVEGVVLLEVLIDETGRVRKVKVLKKLGYGLDEAAIEAVKKSSFSPGMRDKTPVATKIQIPFRFVLED